LYRQWGPAAEHHLEERVRLRGAADFDAYLFAVVRSIHGMLDGPVADELDRLAPSIRVTVVYGEDDAMIPNPFLHGGATAEVARAAQALLPEALVFTLPGVGHMVQVEAPTQTNALIATLARETPGGNP
jgi:pimeloyl-ACP methyl ester carboxylesterase